jgi:hypothetical protein
MRKTIHPWFSLLLLFTIIQKATAQEWKDVAPIIYKNCSSCHREGEIGPFPFMSYHDLINCPYLYNIPSYVNSGLMPPWKADPNYHHFLDERILSQGEKDLITNWVNAGAPPGDTSLAPPPPVFPTSSQIGTPDLVLTMSESHTLAGQGKDEYICFVLPTNLLQDKNVSAIEFRPGNGAAVHHVFMYLVEDSSAVYADQATPEYGYPSFGGAGPNVHANFLGLYAPGMIPRYFPAGGVMNFPAGSFFLIQVHYAPLTYVATDQSSVNLFFSTNPSPRTAKANKIGEGYILNTPFKIQANTIDTFYSQFPVTNDYSLFGIAPHQHLIGKSFKVYAVTQTEDTIPLIYIPDWDFHWQLLYSYPNLIHLTAGSVVNAVAVYDNTSNNPDNPYNPPQQITYGENSTDEMFKYLICTLPYEPGDEDIIIDSNYNSVNDPPIDGIVTTPQFYGCYPNPASDEIAVSYFLPAAAEISLMIHDELGRVMMQKEISSSGGIRKIDVEVNSFESGTYYVSLQVNGKLYTKPLIVQHQ